MRVEKRRFSRKEPADELKPECKQSTELLLFVNKIRNK
jgi:hypothetical protein